VNDIVNKSRSALREATNDFVKTTKRAQTALVKERDRLAANINRLNERIKRMEAGAKLKRGLADAKAEARLMRAEFKIVSADLRDAGTHISHALHIDRAVQSIEAKAKAAMQKSKKIKVTKDKKKPVGKKKLAGSKKSASKKQPTRRAVTKRSSKSTVAAAKK